MPIHTYTGQDNHWLNGKPIKDFASGTVVSIEFSEDLTTREKGSGGTITALNLAGTQGVLTVQVIKGSDDHKYLQTLVSSVINDFKNTQPTSWTSRKNFGPGSYEDTHLVNLVSKKVASVISDNAGNTEQGKVSYEFWVDFQSVIIV